MTRPASLPPHERLKKDECLQTAAKKNPALDANDYGTLAVRLEYADLRELQDTITNKALWLLFESRFATTPPRPTR